MELFDDDMEDEEDASWRKSSKKGKPDDKKKKKPTKEERESAKAGFQTVKDMFSNMPQKRKRQENGDAALDDQEDLGDLLQELHEEKKQKIAPSATRFIEMAKPRESLLETAKIRDSPSGSSSKIMAKRKFQAFSVSEPKTTEVKLEPDDEPAMIDVHENGDSFPSSFPNDDDDDIFLMSSSTVEKKEEPPVKVKSAASENGHINGVKKVEVAVKQETSKISYNVNSMNDFQSYVKVESTPPVCDGTNNGLSAMLTTNAEKQQVFKIFQGIIRIVFVTRNVICRY